MELHPKRLFVCIFAFSALVVAGAPAVAQSDETSGETSESSSTTSAETEGSKDSKAAGSETKGSKADGSESEDSKAAGSDTGDQGTSDTDRAKAKSAFGPGTFDVTGSLGLGGLIYATFEPGVDIGVIPVGDGLTISFGGTLGLGYCVFCAGVSAFSQFTVRAWNFSPQARGLFHINSIGESIGAPLDTYVGVSMGPNFYLFSIGLNDVTLRDNVTSFVFTPLLGGRYFPSSLNGFFAFGEFRYQTEWAYSTVTLESEEWGTQFVWRDDYARRGLDFVLGGGFRF